MEFSLHKSRLKTAPIFQFSNILTVSRQVTWPVSCPPALYLLYTQGIGFGELSHAKQLFLQKRTFASSIRGQPDPKIRKLLDPVRSGFHQNT